MFASNAVTAPLLTEKEVGQLINAASSSSRAPDRRLPRQGRPGEQAATVKGSGSEFEEYRTYHAGDELRHIDWRATARSRVTLLRTYQAEITRPVCLLIDRRAGMRYGTRVRLKVTQAVRLGLWLAGRESRAARELSAVIVDSPSHWLPPQRGMRGLTGFIELAIAPCPPIEPGSYEPTWGRILAGLRQHVPEGGKLVMLSDFSGLDDSHTGILRTVGRHCDVVAVRITDPSEVQFPANSDLQLRWGAKVQHLHRSNTQAHLAGDLQGWSESIARSLRTAGINYHELSVEREELAGLGESIL